MCHQKHCFSLFKSHLLNLRKYWTYTNNFKTSSCGWFWSIKVMQVPFLWFFKKFVVIPFYDFSIGWNVVPIIIFYIFSCGNQWKVWKSIPSTYYYNIMSFNNKWCPVSSCSISSSLSLAEFWLLLQSLYLPFITFADLSLSL